jgi:hypothetical protein
MTTNSFIKQIVKQINRNVNGLLSSDFCNQKAFDSVNAIQYGIIHLSRHQANSLADIQTKLNTLMDVAYIGCNHDEYALLQEFITNLTSFNRLEPQQVKQVLGILTNGLYPDEIAELTLVDSIARDFQQLNIIKA